MDLAVTTWPVGGIPPDRPLPTREPVEPDAPAWWTGENTDQFLLEQGVILP
jgi:hypothetical protein